MDEDVLTLSPQEAIAAICFDLRRYGPQTMLCAELLRDVYNDDSTAKRDTGRDGLWIRCSHQHKMQYMGGTDLIEHVCMALKDSLLSPQQIAGLCRRVFQTRAWVISTNESAPGQIGLSTGMEKFRCRLCGRCCLDLDYHKEVTLEDIWRWEAQERADILKWVGTTKGTDQELRYQIWVIPETNRFAEVCPFLKGGPANGQWICAIQATKPEICRQYPFSRKHAVMTGCVGFE